MQVFKKSTALISVTFRKFHSFKVSLIEKRWTEMYVIESSDGIIRLTDTLWLRTRRQSTMYIACIIWKWRKGGDLLLLLLKGLFNVHKKSAKLHKNMCEGKKVKTESENSENFPIWTDYLCSDSKNDRFWISCLKSMEGWRGGT